MVNKDRVRLWVEALESGKYRQGLGYLKAATISGDRYCCLGVACEVAIANGAPITVRPTVGGDRFDETSSVMPVTAVEWFGFNSGNPVILFTPQGMSWITAVVANDDLLWNFSKIAAAVRETYLNSEEG